MIFYGNTHLESLKCFNFDGIILTTFQVQEIKTTYGQFILYFILKMEAFKVAIRAHFKVDIGFCGILTVHLSILIHIIFEEIKLLGILNNNIIQR